MIRLFGIVDDPGAAARLLADPTITVIPAGPIAAVGRSEDSQPVAAQVSDEELLIHDGLLQRLMQVCTVVPFRYGSSADDAAWVSWWMRRREDQLVRLLATLHGRVELAVRARTRPVRAHGAEAPATSAAHLHRSLAEGADAAEAVTDTDGLRGSYLVPAGAVDDFCRHARLVSERMESVDAMSVTGPWPPYSFSSAGSIEQAMTSGRPGPQVRRAG